jgi:8-oxo-dGTP diphosphatase
VSVETVRRIGAYGICRDRHGRVLMVRASAASTRPGAWFLPGGGLDHGEDPAAAVVRELAEETGLVIEVTGVRDVVAEVVPRGERLEHTDGVIYDVAAVGGRERPEVDGTSDLVRWVTPQQAAALPVSGMAARALRLPVPPATPSSPAAPSLPAAVPPLRDGAGPVDPPGPAPRPARGQRFGVYGLVTDPVDRLLLTLIADGYPGAGRWHPPGGGTDIGEQPAEGLSREITEESGQAGRVADLLAVTHHHRRAAVGPEGYPIDWHSVRAIFRVAVDAPTTPRVLDHGGSTARARWFRADEAAALPLTDVGAEVLRRHRDGA